MNQFRSSKTILIPSINPTITPFSTHIFISLLKGNKSSNKIDNRLSISYWMKTLKCSPQSASNWMWMKEYLNWLNPILLRPISSEYNLDFLISQSIRHIQIYFFCLHTRNKKKYFPLFLFKINICIACNKSFDKYLKREGLNMSSIAQEKRMRAKQKKNLFYSKDSFIFVSFHDKFEEKWTVCIKNERSYLKWNFSHFYSHQRNIMGWKRCVNLSELMNWKHFLILLWD